jgi:hypothetical protein
MGNNTATKKGGSAMTKDEFIQHEVSVWGEDYIFDLIDRGYEAVEMVVDGSTRWWWKLESSKAVDSTALTQAGFCATLPASRSVVSPVSTE